MPDTCFGKPKPSGGAEYVCDPNIQDWVKLPGDGGEEPEEPGEEDPENDG